MTLPPDASRDGLVGRLRAYSASCRQMFGGHYSATADLLDEAAASLEARRMPDLTALAEKLRTVLTDEELVEAENVYERAADTYEWKGGSSGISAREHCFNAKREYLIKKLCEALAWHGERPAFLDHVDHTGQPIDQVDALRLSRWDHQTTLQALGDVKRELAHYKAGEQPRVEDRDREIAELKQQITATERPAFSLADAIQRVVREAPLTREQIDDYVRSETGERPDTPAGTSPVTIASGHYLQAWVTCPHCGNTLPAAPAPASPEEK